MQETQETWVLPLNQEDPLEEGMATHSSILAWRIPQREEPGGLQSMGSQRLSQVRSDGAQHTSALRHRGWKQEEGTDPVGLRDAR